MDDHRKDHTDPKRKRPKELQTTNVPTYDVENTDGTNKGRDLFLVNKPQILPWGTEWITQRIQRHRRTTPHWSAHPHQEQDETQKSSYGLDWV